MCARLVGRAERLADVGTDHAYLPMHMLQTGSIRSAVAADINPGPLASARRHAEEQLCADKMRFECCDGLDFPGAEECDAVVCAGMGGETIAGILSRAPWTRNGTRLVLQPQSKLDELCLWLRQNGYGIFNAALAAEGKRMYVALLVRGGASGSLYAEDALSLRRDELLSDWICARIEREEKALKGMMRGADTGEQAGAARETVARLKQYLTSGGNT